MAVLIDTSVLVAYERNRLELGPFVARHEGAVSVVTVSELLHGAHRAQRDDRARRLEKVDYLLAPFIALPITEAVARTHSELWAELEARGDLIGAHDLWIAATALSHNLSVATLDADFARVPGLRVLVP